MTLFKLLSRLKGSRNTHWDPFAYSTDRRMERRLIGDCESMIELLLINLTSENFDKAVAIVQTADEIRGFGPVEQANPDRVRAQQRTMVDNFLTGPPSSRIAA